MDPTQPTGPTPRSDDGSTMPRWVKGFIVAAAAALVIVVMVVVLGDSGGHGPERHLPGDGEGTASSEEGATPVVDG